MSLFWNNQVLLIAPELITAMTGSTVQIGSTGLLYNPVKIIFDNQSTASTVLYVSYDGGTTKTQWKTFAAGEAIVIDDDFYSWPIGTQFYGNGAASGSFSVAYLYLKLAG